jgi:predicted nucleotidyltransferase
MKVLGIIAEYNPFHNGHRYHLQESKELTGADLTVVVMSGNFTQRGEPALIDKWSRTEIALHCGADLVIELPVAYAMGSAEYFAFGAVRLLDSLGAVDTLSFGSESGDLDRLTEIASILVLEPDEYKSHLKDNLSAGKSFPSARQKALSSYVKEKNGKDHLSTLLKSSNNILAVEYIKALMRLKSRITPMTINRIGNDYNCSKLTGEISSATSIRKVLSESSWQTAENLLEFAVPNPSLAILEREMELGRGPVFPSDFSLPLLSTLRKMSKEQLRALPYMEDGLENRISDAAGKAGSFHELTDYICTRRYPNTRIQRILFSALIGLTDAMFESFNSSGGPAYIRILGFSNAGRRLLSSIRGRTALPVITKTANYTSSALPGVSDMLRLESVASDQYVLGYRNQIMRRSGSDFTRSVINKDTVI